MRDETESRSSLTERVTDSIFWNAVLLPAQYMLSLVSSIVVTAVLGTDGYGLLASLNSISSTISTYTDLGMSKSLPKFAHEIQTKHGEEGWNSLVITLVGAKLVLTLLIAVLLNAFSLQVSRFFDVRSHQRTTIAIVSIVLVFQSMSDTLTGVLVSEFRNKAYNLSRLITSLFTPLATILVGLLGGGVLSILSMGIATRLVQVASLWIGTQRSIRVFPIRWFPVIRERVLFRRFVEFSASTYAVVVARYFLSLPFAILMMNYFGLQDRVAYLALGGELASRLGSFVTLPLNYVVGPLLGHTFLDKSYARLRQAYLTMVKIYQLLIIPSSLGVVFLAGFIVTTLYSPGFARSTVILRILVLSNIGSTVLGVSASILQVYERYRSMLMAVVCAIIASVAGMSFLVPSQAAFGAALALVLGNVVLHGSSTLICQSQFSLSYPARFLIKILVSCIPMLVYMPFSDKVDTSVPLAIAYVGFSAIAFWIVFRLQGGIDQSERGFLERSNIPYRALILRILG
jgi:O-antigen/teichoic acid export membrane protein